MERPVAGHDYPRSLGEFQSWFSSEEDCRDYLEWVRWPEGFVCPRCSNPGGWRLGDGRFRCMTCKSCCSVTAGTIFDKTRTPLTLWFRVCWEFATAKNGVSALAVQRELEIGSYQTSWAMLHRLRQALDPPGRDLLSGTVEVDETFIGGVEPGLTGGRARGKKSLVCVAVEVTPPKGFGRCRMAMIEDASAPTLRRFITTRVESGTTVITDGWTGYLSIGSSGYVHVRRSQQAAAARGEDPGGLLPGVHRVDALVKRWLLGTHQGAVEPAHLDSYLNEFVFRFNRRTSRSRGLLFLRVLEFSVKHDPVRYRQLVQHQRSRGTPPMPPHATGHPPSLDRSAIRRPWRA